MAPGDVTAGIKANVFPGSLPRVAHPSESLEAGTFFALFKDGPFAIRSGYEQHGDLPVALRVGTELPQNIQENWREVRGFALRLRLSFEIAVHDCNGLRLRDCAC